MTPWNSFPDISAAPFFAIGAIVSGSFLIRTLYMLIFTPTLNSCENNISPAPSVSILLPARNEASRVLRNNAESLLAQSYCNLEIIAVDDRSTDQTLDILKDVSSVDSDRFTIITGKEPPSGWMGKIFALHQAKQASSGEWLISVDADVIYSAEIISAALSFAHEHNLDALSLLPHVKMESYWESVVIPAVSWLSLMRVSTTQANRKTSNACFGYGNFILFKKNAHDAIGGFEAYRDNILDDCVIMEMLKSRGYNVMVADGSKLMYSRMYSNLREIVLGFAKNSFAALRFSVPRTLGVIFSEVFFILFPLLYIPYSLLHNGPIMTPSIFAATIAVLLFFLTMFLFGMKMKADAKFYFFYPLGHVISIAIVGYSMLSFLAGKGVPWKNRIIVK